MVNDTDRTGVDLMGRKLTGHKVRVKFQKNPNCECGRYKTVGVKQCTRCAKLGNDFCTMWKGQSNEDKE